MKHLLLITIALAYSFSPVFSQRGTREGMEGRERLKEAKEKYLKERLNLSEQEESEFFSVYDEFHRKRQDIRIEMSQNRLNLRKSDLSDKESKAVINAELDLKKAMIDLEKEYVEKFYLVLSPSQVIDLYKAEDDFNKIMMERVRNRGRDGERSGQRRDGRPIPEPQQRNPGAGIR